MQTAADTDEAAIRVLDSGFMTKVFYVFALLAVLSGAIMVGGKWLGRSIAMAGHTDDTQLFEIVLGNNVLAVAANMIRFERSRHDGVAQRLDVYLRWPDMAGYSAAARDDFNHADGRRDIVFLSFEPAMMSRDMSGRYEPIYSSLIESAATSGPAGLEFHSFSPKSGYANEHLAVETGNSKTPFVARCLTGDMAAESLAPCERDLKVGDELALTYRFPAHLLKDWRVLDAAMISVSRRFIRTAQ